MAEQCLHARKVAVALYWSCAAGRMHALDMTCS